MVVGFVWYWLRRCLVRKVSNSIVTAVLDLGVGSLVLGSSCEMAWEIVG